MMRGGEYGGQFSCLIQQLLQLLFSDNPRIHQQFQPELAFVCFFNNHT